MLLQRSGNSSPLGWTTYRFLCSWSVSSGEFVTASDLGFGIGSDPQPRLYFLQPGIVVL